MPICGVEGGTVEMGILSLEEAVPSPSSTLSVLQRIKKWGNMHK